MFNFLIKYLLFSLLKYDEIIIFCGDNVYISVEIRISFYKCWKCLASCARSSLLSECWGKFSRLLCTST